MAQLPEQVLTAKCGSGLLGAFAEKALLVPIDLGELEIALLLAYDLQFIMPPNIGNARASAYLTRETMPLDTDTGDVIARWATLKSVIIAQGVVTNDAGNAGALDRCFYRVLPYPVILIRPPTIVVEGNNAAIALNVILWYVRQEVTRDQLAHLMVKDHA